jgi:hypothetical protein
MDIMASKQLIKDIRKGLDDIKKGRTKSLAAVERQFKLHEN